LNQFVEKQLFHLHAGTRTFDHQLVCVDKLLTYFFVHDRITDIAIPAALYSRIKQETTRDVKDYCNKTKAKLLKGLLYPLGILFENLPTYKNVMEATFENPIDFNPELLPKPNDQFEASAKEHKEFYGKIKCMVQHYKAATVEGTKSICLCGAGGVGKTMAMRLGTLFLMTQGLFILSTALTGKRGVEMAGEHLHHIFKIPTHDQLTVVQAAEKAILALMRDPTHWELLVRRADAVILDELGKNEARTINVISLILKRIRRSGHFMGGTIMISTYDIQQLKPINGLPLLLNSCMLSSFVYRRFVEVLRAKDENLQRMQKISRERREDLIANKSAMKQVLYELLVKCNYIPSINDPSIPDNAVYCFGKNEHCRHAEAKIM
jgi:DNA replication protein DnaC